MINFVRLNAKGVEASVGQAYRADMPKKQIRDNRNRPNANERDRIYWLMSLENATILGPRQEMITQFDFFLVREDQ